MILIIFINYLQIVYKLIRSCAMSEEEKEEKDIYTWSEFDKESYNVENGVTGLLGAGTEYTTQNQNYKNQLQFIIEDDRCFGVYTGNVYTSGHNIFDDDDDGDYYEVEFDIIRDLSFLQWSSREIERFVRGTGFRFGDTFKINTFLETRRQRLRLREKMSIVFSKSSVLQQLPKDCLFQIFTFI
jgi:hypothetical protein